MINELELLNKIKEQLLSNGEFFVKSNSFKREYRLEISSDDWHEIFKTDEYNELKEKK